MTRREFERRRRALRTLLRQLSPRIAREGRTPPMEVEYTFGAVVHPDNQLWYLYNLTTDNVIGTVNFTPGRATIRYRQESWWADTLKVHVYPSRETVVIAASDLRSRREWVKSKLRSAVTSAYRAARQNNNTSRPRGVSYDRNGRLRDSRGRFISSTRAHVMAQLQGIESTTTATEGIYQFSPRAFHRFIPVAPNNFFTAEMEVAEPLTLQDIANAHRAMTDIPLRAVSEFPDLPELPF